MTSKIILALFSEDCQTELVLESLKNPEMITIYGSSNLQAKKKAFTSNVFDQIIFKGDSLQELDKRTLMTISSLLKPNSVLLITS
jgi:hypothetical protein